MTEGADYPKVVGELAIKGVGIVPLVSHKKNGFTLVEVFIVLAVLAVVSSVSVSYYRDYIDDAKRSVRKTNEKMVNDALKKYYQEHMAYPKYMWKNDSVEDIHKNINRGLDTALASYFANKKVSDILSEGANNVRGNKIFYRVTEPRKRDSEIGNVDNTSEVGKWKAAKNLRIETKDYLVNEIMIAENDEGINASTFDNLEKYNFPLKPDTEPIDNTETSYNSVSVDTEFDIQMVCVPPGTFKMGSPSTENGRNNRSGQVTESQHMVTISKSFLISRYEITRQQYYKVLGISDPKPTATGTHPINGISWNDAKAFCNKLNNQYSRFVPYGYKFDLPTEAQWEYACRAGTTSALSSGKEITDPDRNRCPNIDEVGWAYSNSGGRVHKVASVEKIPNQWGIYDMHGNVAEWCLDTRSTTYEDYSFDDPEVPLIDPIRLGGSNYMVRGGGYSSENKRLRSAARDAKGATATDAFLGIRVVLVQTDD